MCRSRVPSLCLQNSGASALMLDLQTARITLGLAPGRARSVPLSGGAPPLLLRNVLSLMSDTFSTRYAALIAAGKIEADPGQAVLAAQSRRRSRTASMQRRLARKSSSLGWLFGKREQAGAPLKGLYVYGEVGRGKTMLMDLFFRDQPGRAQAPRPFPRIHGRRARARSRLSTGNQERRDRRTGSDPARRRGDRRGNLAAVLRRIPRHRYRRRHDPRPPVHAAVRTRHGRWWRRQIWRRTSSTKTGSTARCSCRSSHCWNGIARSCGWKRAPISGWKSSPACRPGMCRPTARPMPRSTKPGGGSPAAMPGRRRN